MRQPEKQAIVEIVVPHPWFRPSFPTESFPLGVCGSLLRIGRHHTLAVRHQLHVRYPNQLNDTEQALMCGIMRRCMVISVCMNLRNGCSGRHGMSSWVDIVKF